MSSKNRHQNLRNGTCEMLMTYKMRSVLVVSASTRAGGAIAGTMSAAINSGGPAAAAESPRAASTAAEVRQLIYSLWAKFCGEGSDPKAREVCFPGQGAHRHRQPQ